MQLSVPDGFYARLDIATPITDVCESVSSNFTDCVNPGNDRDPQYWFRLGYEF